MSYKDLELLDDILELIDDVQSNSDLELLDEINDIIEEMREEIIEKRKKDLGYGGSWGGSASGIP